MTTETYSPAEEPFNRHRQTFGLIAGPLSRSPFSLMPTALAPAAQRVGAVLALMIVLWMTRSAAARRHRACSARRCASSSASPPRKWRMRHSPTPSSFCSSAASCSPRAWWRTGSIVGSRSPRLHRQWVGSSGLRLVVAYAGVTCFLSMWMSNTATTAMMFPLGLAVLSELGRERKGDRAFQRYAMAMMLVTSFSATIGGMGTPVGTPPNLIGLGLLRTTAGINVSFTGWMLVGVPIMAVTMASLVAWFLAPSARAIRLGPEAVRTVADELRKLGPMTMGERNVVIAFSATVALWVLPGVFSLVLGETHAATRRVMALFPESVAAIVGGLLLLIIPVSWRERRFTLSWAEASRIDWGIVLLVRRRAGDGTAV